MLPGTSTKTNVGILIGIALGLIGRMCQGSVPSFIGWYLMVIGGVFYMWGCVYYAMGKGHAPTWGLIALLPFGIVILAVLPDKYPAQGRGCLFTAAMAFLAIAFTFIVIGVVGSIHGWRAASHPFTAGMTWSANERQGERPPNPVPATPSPNAAQTTAAQQRAIKQFPDLAVANSKLNQEFVRRYRQYQKEKPAFFNDPEWPTALARECQVTIPTR